MSSENQPYQHHSSENRTRPSVINFVERQFKKLTKDRVNLVSIIREINTGTYDFESVVTSSELNQKFIVEVEDDQAPFPIYKKSKEWTKFVPKIMSKLKPEKNAITSIIIEKSWPFFKQNNNKKKIIEKVNQITSSQSEQSMSKKVWDSVSTLTRQSAKDFSNAIDQIWQIEGEENSQIFKRFSLIAKFMDKNAVLGGFEGKPAELVSSGVGTAATLIRSLIIAIPQVFETNNLEITPELYKSTLEESYSSIVKRLSMLHTHIGVPILEEMDTRNLTNSSEFNSDRFFKIEKTKKGYKLKLKEEFLLEQLQHSQKNNKLAKIYIAYLKIFSPQTIPTWIHSRFSTLFRKLPSVSTWCPANFSKAEDEQKNVIKAFFDWHVEVAEEAGIFNLVAK